MGWISVITHILVVVQSHEVVTIGVQLVTIGSHVVPPPEHDVQTPVLHAFVVHFAVVV